MRQGRYDSSDAVAQSPPLPETLIHTRSTRLEKRSRKRDGASEGLLVLAAGRIARKRIARKRIASLSRCPVFIARDLSGFAFSSLLSFSLRVSGRRRCGSVEIRRFWVWPDFQARWKEGESPPFDFSTLSTARHFHSVARAVFSRPPATRPPPCTVRPREDRRRWSPAHPGARRWSPGKPPASLATVSARSATPDSLAERCCPWPPPARSAPRRSGPSPSLARGQTHGPSPPPLRRTCG